MSSPSTSSSDKFNARSPSVKRVMQEIKELQNDKSSEYCAVCMEDDIFEWHFIIRGSSGSEFEGGLYHGRILLPPDYPMKPPAFQMLTPSGRFEVGVKICLSISSHHPEAWQPSWSVRTALTALIAFMPSPPNGSVGSLDYSNEERVKLAAKARLEPPSFGSPERQALIREMHAKMLQRIQGEEGGDAAPSASAATEALDPVAARLSFDSALPKIVEAVEEKIKHPEVPLTPAAEASALATTESVHPSPSPDPAPTIAPAPSTSPVPIPVQRVQGNLRGQQGSDQGLTILAWALVFAIFAILAKKIYAH